MILYGEHGYTPNFEVSLDSIKTMFGAICGGDLDAWMEACKLDNVVPNNSEPKIYFPVNIFHSFIYYIYIYLYINVYVYIIY